jgi:methionyl aminopeptidase
MVRLKSTEEIAILREGGRRLALILSALKDMVKPGISSAELEAEALRLCEHYEGKPAFKGYTPHGADRPFPSALCLTVNDGVVHGIPDEHPFELGAGDLVTLDMGLVYRGFITDAAITIGVGDIDMLDKKARALLEAGEKCLEAGIFAARAGNKTGDIGHAISTTLQYYQKTFGFHFAEGLGGHGVGHSVHEDPFVPNFSRPHQGVLLQPGLVIAIEPIINEKGDGIVLEDDGYTIKTADGGRSVHFEHTIVITESGEAEILTCM